MEPSRPEYLMDRLLNNRLSGEELEELLAGIGENEMSPEYSFILERFFNGLLEDTNLPKGTDPEQNPELIS